MHTAAGRRATRDKSIRHMREEETVRCEETRKETEEMMNDGASERSEEVKDEETARGGR